VQIHRRQLLASAAGGTGLMLSPLMGSVFAQLKARASGSRKHPLRFVFLMKSNGLWAENIQPQGLENRLPFEVAYDKDGRLQNGNHGGVRKKPTPGTDLQLDDEVSLSTVMQPLETYRRRVSILQGIAAGFSVYHKATTRGSVHSPRRSGTHPKLPDPQSIRCSRGLSPHQYPMSAWGMIRRPHPESLTSPHRQPDLVNHCLSTQSRSEPIKSCLASSVKAMRKTNTTRSPIFWTSLSMIPGGCERKLPDRNANNWIVTLALSNRSGKVAVKSKR